MQLLPLTKATVVLLRKTAVGCIGLTRKQESFVTSDLSFVRAAPFRGNDRASVFVWVVAQVPTYHSLGVAVATRYNQ